ncbi:MAG: tetratricopeptide repeat protein [Actinomycetota bacterium]|nr:tetratricopeptide repeat protein [Actinomycetota bacterium]
MNLRGFDPLGKLVSPEQAVRTLLDALQVAAGQIPAGVDAQAGLYRSLLSGKRMLVVLDNACDAEQVRLLLPGSPGCMVLVTSRRQLRGLVACENAHYLPLDLLSDTEAHEMLSRRVGAARLAAAPQVTAELIGMCARLPLALAIAAASISVRPRLGLDTFAEELRDARRRLDALDTGEAASSIRTVFSWSAGNVSDPAARLFALLGLHPGPDISIPAAASLAGTPPPQARQALAELAEAHLVSEHAPARFAMHDLLRAYATEQASAYDAAEQRGALHRMCDYYAHTSRTANRVAFPARDPLMLAAPQAGTVTEAFTGAQLAQTWMEAERSVLVAVTAQAAASCFDSHAWQISYYLAMFLDLHGYWAEWAATQQTALVCAQRLGDLVAQARIHLITSHYYVRLGSWHDAEIRLSSALRLYQQVQDDIGQARVHVASSLVLNHQGKHGDALGHAHQALALYRAAEHQAGLAGALNAVGWSEAHLDHPQRAVATCTEAIGLHRETGNRLGEAEGWDSLGYAYHRLGDHRQAIGCYERAIDRHQELAARYPEACVWTRMGDVHLASGHLERARLSWERALAGLTEEHHPDAERVRRRLQHLDSAADGDLGKRSDPGAEPLFHPVDLAAPGS